MEGKVLKGIGGNYEVKLGNDVVKAVQTGNLKKEIKILIGDNVELTKDDYGTGYVITKVLPRKNSLVRPTVANIDQLVIIISFSPEPDFYLVDKLLVNCFINNIEPILVINKIDIIPTDALNDIISEYKNVVKRIVLTSAVKGDVEELKRFLKYKVSVFAGQSAVGKSSILNALNPKINQATNILSKKVDRGQHTTRVCEIFEFDDCLITDTPGFSMLEINELEPVKLESYYPEFAPYRECKFNNCSHVNTSASKCGVIDALNKNLINRARYDRYVELYNKLRTSWENKYD